MKIFVKREDTGKVARIELEDNQQVFDLLELCQVELKFGDDAVLKAKVEDKELNFMDLVKDIDETKTLLIIDEQGKKAKKEETAAKDKENLANAEEIRDRVKKNVKNNEQSESMFAQQGSSTSEAKHDLLSDLQSRTGGDRATKESFQVVGEGEEINILNRKMRAEGLDGFLYEIIPESYVDQNESKYVESSFSSEGERKASQSKTSSTKEWSSWNAEAGGSFWGVSVAASAGQDSSTRQADRYQNQSKMKVKTAIVTKTCFHQMKQFKVTPKLNDVAIRDAKQILKANMHEKRHAITEFCNKYCCFVYTGQFSAGGWFRTVATAKSTEEMEFTALEKEAAAKTEIHWAVGASGYGFSAGAGGNVGSSNQRNEQQTQQNTNSSVQVNILKESAPGNTSSENDLENKIKNPKNWTVFPTITANKAHYTQIFEIIKRQAVESNDEDLDKVADVMKLYMKGLAINMDNIQVPPYVVLLGDVGTGKSTLVEKMTGEKGRSSDANQSVTKTSEPFWVPDGSLILCDTPGSNAMRDKLEHNVWIAGALNFRPVNRIFIVVKAEARIDCVVDDVRKYADRFLDLPMDVVGVLVTHMDTVGWAKEDFTPLIKEELGMDTVVFSWLNTPPENLICDILKTCKKRHNLTVNDENFLKLFKIHNNHRKILEVTSRELKNFEDKKKSFDEVRKAFSGKDQVDLIFEFQAYMTDEITKAQKRISEENNFTFLGDGAANEAGHVANMVNQLRMVLYDIRTEAIGFQSEHGVAELRKCPNCGLIWTKVEGCDGDTTCGNRPNPIDIRDGDFAVLGTFSFSWTNGKLQVKKCGTKSVSREQDGKNVGCGKTINWKNMASVKVPSELSESKKVGTQDVALLPPEAKGFRANLRNDIKSAQDKMRLPNRPNNGGGNS